MISFLIDGLKGIMQMTESSQYSIQIMLPSLLDRRFRKWAEQTPGASWPAWGGHITLMPRFQPQIPPAALHETIAAICARYRSMDVHLTSLVAMQDWTREAYFGVFLVPPAEPGSGIRRLSALQRDFATALGDKSIDLASDVTQRDFAPHITLALGVSESEAEKMVSQVRAQNLTAEFRVRRVWLMQFSATADGETTVERKAFRLRSRSSNV